MNSTPEIDSILDELTEIGCDALSADDSPDMARVDDLVASLSTNGWKRHSEGEPPLSVIVKDRIKQRCKEPGMHRGAAIDGIVSKIQQAYDKTSRMETSSPTSGHDQPLPPRTTA